MVIGLIGEGCTGKTTLANALKEVFDFKLYSGKEYLAFAKNAVNAKQMFKEYLKGKTKTDELVVYVITELPDFNLLPEEGIKILKKSDIKIIKERFKDRMYGNLPIGVEKMLEKKHGQFDYLNYDLVLTSEELENNLTAVINLLKNKEIEIDRRIHY
ncbi:MAG: hypothetical protein WCY80_02500 [Candidatus Izemoplasmatales bacterium]